MATDTGIRTILDALAEPALIVEHRIVRMANDAARDILGAAIEGKDVRLAIRHPQVLEHLLEGTAADIETSGIGEFRRPWTVSVRTLDADTRLVRLLDRSAAVAAERMRVDFVANASHELRTPLSVILGYAETLAEDPALDSAIRARFGDIIRTEAKRMVRIVEDLMSLSRIEADRFVAPTEEVSIEEIARISAEHGREFAGQSECRVVVEAEAGLPKVRGDLAQLVQMLDNLVSNAVRYGCPSSGCTVRVALARRRGEVMLTVSDQGEGIAAEHLPRLTERFYRVDTTRSRATGGTGLGLALVKHIVERHRGTLEIRSMPGQGTDVIVRLPVSR